MKHFVPAFMLTVLTVLTVSPLKAQPPGGGRGPDGGPEAMIKKMMSYDDNEDGKLSKEEIPERLQSMFARADKDKDGLLTKDEISADLRNRENGRGQDGERRRPRDGDGRGPEGEGRGPRDGEGRGGRPGDRGGEGGGRGGEGGGRGFGRPGEGGGFGERRMPPFPVMMALDADGNGEISADEINNATAALKKLDRNRNGKLDADELRPQGGFGGPGGREGGPGGGGRVGVGPEGASGPGRMVDFMLDRFDGDKDGKISKEEAPDRMAENFGNHDGNKDGFLDKKEIEEMARQFAGRAGGGGGRGGAGGPGGGRGGDGGRGGNDRGERRRPPVEE